MLPSARSVEKSPDNERLRELALERMPRLTATEFGNLNYQALVTARLKNSTFFVSDTDIKQNRIGRDEATDWAKKQDEYLADKEMILIEGYIGPDPDFRTA
jgi:phosphoenolpyruvate carboxykinase (ATP)